MAEPCSANTADNTNKITCTMGSGATTTTCWPSGSSNTSVKYDDNQTAESHLLCSDGSTTTWAPTSVRLDCASINLYIDNTNTCSTKYEIRGKNYNTSGTVDLNISNFVCDQANKGLAAGAFSTSASHNTCYNNSQWSQTASCS